ncbi:hypothetical protein [Pseudomonas sp. RL_105y_Pfl2_101]|uniref:hypothetical protein n=1 Tax=Pseudomonas sp. RL_105y_Pfl2_101 TaxID=3088708 RepID=UPI0030D740CA
MPPAFLRDATRRMGAQAVELESLLAELLRNVQRTENVPGFGLCKTCRFHQHVTGAPFCGLTQEPLAHTDIELICREHEFASQTS